MADRDNSIAGLFFIGLAVLLFMLWKASGALGLDLDTGLRVFFGLLVAAAIFVACWLVSNELELIKPANTWWVAAAVAWVAIWPALDVWGGVPTGGSDFGPYSYSNPHSDIAFYARTWFKWSVLGVIVVGGATHACRRWNY